MGKLESPMDKAFVAMSIITWIAGGAVLAIGIVLLVDENTFDQVKILEPDYSTPLIWQAAVMMMVAVGCYTFLIGFVGWIGHLFDNKQTLLAYIVLGSIAAGALLSSGLLATIFKLDVNSDESNTKFSETFLSGNYSDTYQTQYECCGITGLEDWLNMTGTIPQSCCSDNSTAVCTEGKAFPEGCYTTMKSAVDFDTALIMGLSFSVFATQLCGTAIGGVLYAQMGGRVSPRG